MPAKKEETPNPMLGKNIPPPPPINPVTASAAISSERENGKTVPGQNEIASVPAAAPQATKAKREEGELATVELSLYLRPAQDDKLEDLRRAYKRRTGKKISANEVVRRLIDKATLEDIVSQK